MMITWDLFLPFAAVSVILWTAGVAATLCNKDRCSKVALGCTATFTLCLWEVCG